MRLPFADYVNHARIKESQYLLQTTNHSILDISISVGFNNQNYFTTIFKKLTGITPKQYRMRSSRAN
jgi:YesN/AraC family two-component response regulator